jgi:hypothetical protein
MMTTKESVMKKFQELSVAIKDFVVRFISNHRLLCTFIGVIVVGVTIQIVFGIDLGFRLIYHNVRYI